MEELFKQLETKISSLLNSHERLSEAHQQLSSMHASIKNEKELLVNKQTQAITQIQALIVKLKTIEKSS